MKIRKIKKAIKKIDDPRFQRMTLMSLKKIEVWSKMDHKNSKSNIKILTKKFLYKR